MKKYLLMLAFSSFLLCPARIGAMDFGSGSSSSSSSSGRLPLLEQAGIITTFISYGLHITSKWFLNFWSENFQKKKVNPHDAVLMMAIACSPDSLGECDLDMIERLIHPATLSIVNDRDETVLMKAVQSGKIEIVDLLLKQPGLNINAQDLDGNTALMMAADYQHIDIINLLLKCEQIDVDIKDNFCTTAFMRSVENGDLPVVRCLLASGRININERDADYGETALMKAVQRGNMEMVDLLLKQPRLDINATAGDGRTALMMAEEHHHEAIKQLLLAYASETI